MAKITIERKDISRKSLRPFIKKVPLLKKFSIEFRVRKNRKLIKTFIDRKKAELFAKKLREKLKKQR